MAGLPSTEIIGFSLSGPPPLGEVHIPWEKGLSVLYGANGSGKTTILRGIEQALTGVVGSQDGVDDSASAFVHVRLVGWDEPLVGNTGAGMSLAEYLRAGQRTYDVADELTASILDNLKGRIRQPKAWWDQTRIPREDALELVNRADSLEDGEVGPAPSEFLRAFTAVGEYEPILTFMPRGGDDTTRSDNGYFGFLGYPRGEGEGHENRELSLRYELLRVRVEQRLAEIPSEERTESLLKDVATAVYGEIEAEGVPMTQVDLEYAVLCLDAIASHDDVRDGSGFWTNYQGFAGKDDRGFPSLFGEAVLAPAWVPVVGNSILLDGAFDGFPTVVSTSKSTFADLHRRAIQIHRRVAQMRDATPAELTESLRDSQNETEQRANDVRRLLFPELPQLSWRPGTAAEWIDGTPFVWEAIDEMTGRAIPIDRLSEAQQRWAGLVLALNAGGRDILLIDEPELGLHQRAAALTGRRLAAFADHEGIPAIVASHAAEFLALDSSMPLHVLRRPSDGKTIINPVDRAEIVKKAEALDLDVVALLQFIRTWIVVEGEHDRALIDELIGEELRASGAELVTMRGARNIVTLADAEVLFRYTDASIILVLDAIDNVEAIQAMWNTATSAVRKGRPSQALKVIGDYRRHHPQPGYEERQLLAFAQEAIGIADPSRVRLFGLKAKDIIEYVPPDRFGLDQSWADLRAEYDSYMLNKGSFKNWLELRKNARINVDSVRSGASEVPVEDRWEFTALLNMASH